MSSALVERHPAEVGRALLSARGLVKRFGGVAAVDGVDMAVWPGKPVAVIGPNGAGKSTLLKLIAGELRPDQGELLLDGRSHGRARCHRIARRGVALAHQVPLPFARLTVRENVRVGALHRHGVKLSSSEVVDRVLERCGLIDRSERLAGSLTLLDLKRLELARALSLEPKLLLLDEVAAGLVGSELRTIIELVAGIRDEGVTLIVVEHVEGVVRELVEQVIVLDWGKVIAEGTPAEIAANALVREVYFGAGQPGSSRAGAGAPTTTAAQPRPARASEPGASGAAASPPAPPSNTGAALALHRVSAGYGSILALRDVDLVVAPGAVVAVLGANGAGKSTLAGTISGLVSLRAGRLELDGEDVSALAAHERARRGIAHCQEGRRLFPGLSVEENLILAARSGSAHEQLEERRRWVQELFPILAQRRKQQAQTLSGGQQQMVAIARALMACPRLVVFDEISLGLAPAAIDALYEAIAEISRAGISIVLVEQNVRRSLSLADRAYVLERGRVSFAGDPRELLDERRLEAAYFGFGAAAGSEDAAAPGATVQHRGE
jgi:branched-chain amino acid transport system ATP-binding protein